MDRIKAQPTEGLSYNPSEPKYWEPKGLEQELTRVFDVCQSCRLCFNLCPSFPTLFAAVEEHEGDAAALSAAERQEVVDLCYGCKLCEIRCPYTPRDGHEFQLDFPRLMQRAKALEARQHGVGLRNKLLGDPDKLGKLGSLTPFMANWANNSRFHRIVMEKLLGIHRDKKLPDFQGETFERWLSSHPLPAAPADPAAKVALFHTCFINYNDPAPGRAAVAVLSKNQCAIRCPRQNCCGMPALDGGDVEFARKQAQSNIDSLLPLVKEGWQVAVINPTCSLMMRQEYPRLIDHDDARALAAAVVDTHELLYQLRRVERFNREFRSTPGAVAYHIPCHLKAQHIGLRARDLMRLIPGAEITSVDACCAHDGTWAMKKEFFPLSMQWGEKAFSGMRDAQARLMATDCPLAALQIEQATGVHPIHPLEVLARAYDPKGFEQAVPPAQAKNP
ncbi:MAG TPA: anaerobic glycerol-3-phosphate dehydrogenase subunit C [Candidatus Binataceae bacterium]|nr:anaerobic glycerol-3-phosphate dehydrogenase subunit C [Candidatus Binataceae bacterium]